MVENLLVIILMSIPWAILIALSIIFTVKKIKENNIIAKRRCFKLIQGDKSEKIRHRH